MLTYFLSRQVRNILLPRNGLDVSDVRNTTSGALALIYRPEKEMWEESYSILDIQEKDIWVLTVKEPQNFWSNVIKTYVTPELSSDSETILSNEIRAYLLKATRKAREAIICEREQTTRKVL